MQYKFVRTVVTILALTASAFASAIHLRIETPKGECAAVAVSSEFIVSAAHCLETSRAGDITIKDTPSIRATEIIIPSGWAFPKGDQRSDIVLIRINHNATPEPLYFIDNFEIIDASTSITYFSSYRNQSGSESFVIFEECGGLPNALCSARFTNRSGVIPGDSGTPVFYKGRLLGVIVGSISTEIKIVLIGGIAGLEILRKQFSESVLEQMFGRSLNAEVTKPLDFPVTPPLEISRKPSIPPPSSVDITIPSAPAVTSSSPVSTAIPSLPSASMADAQTMNPEPSSKVVDVQYATGGVIFSSGEQLCMLYFIHPRVAVTSAHCLESIDEPALVLQAGEGKAVSFHHDLSNAELSYIRSHPLEPLPTGKDFIFIEFDTSQKSHSKLSSELNLTTSRSNWYIAGFNIFNKIVAKNVVAMTPPFLGKGGAILTVQVANPGIRRSGFLLNHEGHLLATLAGCSAKQCQFTSLLSPLATRVWNDLKKRL